MSDIIHEVQEKLWKAAEEGDCGAIRYLVMNGADIGARDPLERTALNIATQYGHVEAVKTLLAAKRMKFMMALGLSPEEAAAQEAGTSSSDKEKASRVKRA